MIEDEKYRKKLKEMSQTQSHRNAMRFRMIGRMLHRSMERKAAATGVYRSQHQLLMNVYFKPEMSQVSLAELMEISPAAIAVTLNKLEKGGYIKRENKAGDSRANQIVITQKGRDIIDYSIKMFEEIDRNLFAGFSEEEMIVFGGYLDRMYGNLLNREGRREDKL